VIIFFSISIAGKRGFVSSSTEKELIILRFSGSAEWVHPPDGTAGTPAAKGEESAGEPAASAKRDGVESRVSGDDERDASVMLGPPSEASRPRCPHGVDLALAGSPRICSSSPLRAASGFP
jgi:hypothetical protein